MTSEAEKEAMEKLISRFENIEKNKNLYNITSIVLSILDVVCGLICLFYSSILITSVVVSTLTGLVVGTRTIQIIKAERLAKTLGIVLKETWARRIFSVCLLYLTTRIKRGNSEMAKWLKANKFSVLMGILACGIVAGAVWFLIASYWVAAPLWASILITCAAGIASSVAVYFLGAETVIGYTLRISANKLPEEQAKLLTENAVNAANVIREAEKLEKENAKKLAEAKAQAEAELKAQQQAELEELAKKKFEELKSKLENDQDVKVEIIETEQQKEAQ